MANPETLATVASIIAGFGAAMLGFRIEPEVASQEKGQQSWIPWADQLLIAAILLALLLVVLPLLSSLSKTYRICRENSPCCLFSDLCFAIRLHICNPSPLPTAFWAKAKGREQNPEPAERWIVVQRQLSRQSCSSGC